MLDRYNVGIIATVFFFSSAGVLLNRPPNEIPVAVVITTSQKLIHSFLSKIIGIHKQKMSNLSPLDYPLGFAEVFSITAKPIACVGSASVNANLSRHLPGARLIIEGTQRGLNDLSITAELSQKRVTVSTIVRPGAANKLHWLPTVSYKPESFRGISGVQATLNLAEKTVGVSVEESAYRGSIATKVLDGLSSEVSLSARLVEQVYGGLFFTYDPSRSGLKDYRYALLLRNRQEFRNGDAMVSYDAIRGWGASFRVPLRKQTSAQVVVAPAPKEFVIGADIRCPTGTAQIVAGLNVFQQSLRISGWKRVTEGLKVNFTMDSSLKQIVPKVGVNVAFE